MPSIGSVNRTMLKTMSSFSLRAQARMFSASSRFMWKMVVEMPKLKGYFFCSSCIARMVSFAFSKPRFTCRTLLCISPTPSIETRVLKMMLRSWHISTIFVSIGMPRCGVRPVVLRPNLRSFGSRSSMTRQISTRSLRVVGSPPETLAFSMFFQRLRLEDLVDVGERHVALAVAPLPVPAHLAARVAHERAVENQHGRVNRAVAGDIAVDDVAGGADRRLGEVLQRVDLCHKVLILNLLRLEVKPAPGEEAG